MNTPTRRILSTAAATGVLSLAATVPAVAKPEWTEPAAPANGSTTSEPTTGIREVFVDDDSWEYVQIGLGALAGASLVGVAAVALRRHDQHAPHPA
jgi:hypothetical protein